ncbi:creatininase family protein [Fuscovulum ytuae]|uniref:Creatininase family protein n=1 Tax=Fuscovulum ytuae TaxID=3042299 RepID=A0ABY8QC05_9RHOB|nr:creatininase family protein [Fuscovulum sp. YMD61]WGV18243.1 creatininase family protein [Fuscovulum sp. YMD61]
MTRQIERLRPHQINEALQEASLIYLPLGTIEWHCHHLPVGLDALTAHGLCLRAAERTGGLVWPTLYYGTGGDHGDFPWTVMMPDATEIEALLTFTLRRLRDLGVKRVVLFSGHFADTQLEMIDRLASNWNLRNSQPKVVALSVNRALIPGQPPDHAGLFETTLLDGIAPGLSDINRLSSDPDTAHRLDPQSPLWGIVGTDPRQHAVMEPAELVERVVLWMKGSVQTAAK